MRAYDASHDRRLHPPGREPRPVPGSNGVHGRQDSIHGLSSRKSPGVDSSAEAVRARTRNRTGDSHAAVCRRHDARPRTPARHPAHTTVQSARRAGAACGHCVDTPFAPSPFGCLRQRLRRREPAHPAEQTTTKVADKAESALRMIPHVDDSVPADAYDVHELLAPRVAREALRARAQREPDRG